MNPPPDDLKTYLHKLDQGTLSPPEREALLEALQRLANQPDEDALLELDLSALVALGNPHSPLSRDEADELFNRVTSPEATRRRPPASSWFKRRAFRRLAGLTTAAAALCALWLWWRTPAPIEHLDPTIKSAQAKLALSLEVFLGERADGQAIVSHTLKPQARVSKEQHLLFRYRLGQPAWLALSARRDGAPAKLLWQSEGAHQAGDFELSNQGQALSMPLRDYPPGPLRITLWAARSPQHWEEIISGLPCTACSSDQLLLTVSH